MDCQRCGHAQDLHAGGYGVCTAETLRGPDGKKPICGCKAYRTSEPVEMREIEIELPDTVWVLTKEVATYGSDETNTTVIGVYGTREGLEARLLRIAQANARYELRPCRGGNMWRIGPDEDEGFFGAQPIWLRATKVRFTP